MADKRISQLRIGIVGAVLLLSGVLYVLFPLFAVRWAQRPFPGLLIDPNLVVSDTGENDWPAKRLSPPVTYPERGTAVDGQPVTSNQSLYDTLSDRAAGTEVGLTLVQPQDSLVDPSRPQQLERTVTVPLIEIGIDGLWNQFWLLYLVGLVVLIIGAWTFRVHPEAEAAQVFALFSASGALAIGALFDLTTTQNFVRIWIAALSLAGSFNILLAAVFPHELRLVSRWPRSKWLILIPGLVVAVWGQVWLHHPSDPWAYAIPWRAAYGLNGVALLISLAIIAYRGFRSPSPLVRQQGRLILGGAILAFAPLLFFFAIASIPLQLSWLKPVLYIPPVIIYPLAIGYTIIRYRLLNVDIVRRGLSYAILTGLLASAFALIATGLTAGLQPVVEISSPILLAVFIIIVAVVFDPLRVRLQRGLDQYFFREPVAFDELLRTYNRELTTAVDADQVASVLLEYVNTGLPAATAHLYLPDGKTGCYTQYANSDHAMVDADSPLVQFMQRRPGGAVDLAEERAWPPTLRQHRQAVLDLNASVIVPMNNGQQLLGWLTLSEKKNDQHFTQAELTYLSALADQSLIGLERANVIRRLETRVAELDALSQFSQALNFTIEFDDLLELVYTNYHRLFAIDDFSVSLSDPETQRVYTAFYVEAGERIRERERSGQLVDDALVQQVMQTGQMVVMTNEDGRVLMAAPLNAGADTLGVLHTSYGASEHHFRRQQQKLFSVLADRTAVALDRLQARQQLEARARQLEIINEVTLSLASTLELEPLLELILDKAMELLDTQAGTVMLTIEDTGELEFRVVRGPASQSLVGTRLPIGTGLAGAVAQTGRPMLINDAQADERWFADVDASTAFETNSILAVPLLRQNTVLGVVQLINKRSGAHFDEEDQQLLTAFAGQAVVALENARLLEQTDQALQDRVNELFMLQQLDRDLNTTLDLDHVLNLTLDWTLRICGGTAGAIVLVNEEEQPRIRATRGYDESFNLETITIEALNIGFVGRVLSTGEPYVSGNVHEEPNYISASFSTHSQMTLPIVHKQRLIGAITVESDQFNAFDTSAVETAVRVTNHAAAAIANALLYEEVNEANRAKTEFVSMVSHELRTPMTSMRGYTDLMLSGMTGELTPQQQSFLETIAANIRRMNQQIQDLTDISRIETGRLRMEFAPTAFTNVVSETLQTVKGLCQEKDIELHLDLPADLPLVMGDKERLVQVLTNLLSNACKYSPPEKDVYVQLKPELMSIPDDQPPQPVVVCSVADHGYGISEADQEMLFTKFFRSEDPSIRKAAGTGLGLSITRGIVELHDGRIWVESELGQGTTFHFAIPQVSK